MTKELRGEIIAAAIEYEAAWNRYAHYSEGDSTEIIIAKAHAHQALLKTVRVYRDWIMATEQG